MVSALLPDRAVWLRALAREHCVVFMGKTSYSHSASLFRSALLSCILGNPVFVSQAIEIGLKEQSHILNTSK